MEACPEGVHALVHLAGAGVLHAVGEERGEHPDGQLCPAHLQTKQGSAHTP